MTTAAISRPTPGNETADDAIDRLIAVHNCSRLGMRANPPRRGLLELLLPSRRR
ncbi:MAG: hypothetical protein WCE30_12265 [Mycobacterium sp.]